MTDIKSNADRTCRETVGKPHTRMGDAGYCQDDQGTLSPQASPCVPAENTRGVRAWRGLARGMGKYGMRAWGCEEKNPKRNPRKLRNTSLVIRTPAGGAGRGRGLYLPG